MPSLNCGPARLAVSAAVAAWQARSAAVSAHNPQNTKTQIHKSLETALENPKTQIHKRKKSPKLQKKETHLCKNMHNVVAYHANLKTNYTSMREGDKLIVSWESKTQIWLKTHKNRKRRLGADKHNLRASCSWSAQLANAPSYSLTPPCRSVSQLLRNRNFSSFDDKLNLSTEGIFDKK